MIEKYFPYPQENQFEAILSKLLGMANSSAKWINKKNLTLLRKILNQGAPAEVVFALLTIQHYGQHYTSSMTATYQSAETLAAYLWLLRDLVDKGVSARDALDLLIARKEMTYTVEKRKESDRDDRGHKYYYTVTTVTYEDGKESSNTYKRYWSVKSTIFSEYRGDIKKLYLKTVKACLMKFVFSSTPEESEEFALQIGKICSIKSYATKLTELNAVLINYDLNTRQKYAWCSLPIQILFLQGTQTIPMDIMIIIVSYQFNLTPTEIIDLYGKLTLHFYREFLCSEINDKYLTFINFTKTHTEQAQNLISEVQEVESTGEFALVLEKEKTSLEKEFQETRALEENTPKNFVSSVITFFKKPNTNQEENSRYYGIIERHSNRFN